jgi:hypothetical protein
MTKEQAEALAAEIRTQFPRHDIKALPSADMRHIPYHWFIGIQRIDGGDVLVVHSQFEWQQALLAWNILSD